MIYDVGKFRHYVLGSTFIFHVNHEALIYIVNKAFLVGKMARWMLILQKFDFAIQHTPGQANTLADFLFRLENIEPSKEVYAELSDASLFSITHLGEGDWYDKMVNFPLDYQFPNEWPKNKRTQLALKSKHFTVKVG